MDLGAANRNLTKWVSRLCRSWYRYQNLGYKLDKRGSTRQEWAVVQHYFLTANKGGTAEYKPRPLDGAFHLGFGGSSDGN